MSQTYQEQSKRFKKEDIWVIGLRWYILKSTIYDVNLTDATAIVMGAEGKGIRPG
jgi:tRNA G18 (ribose-2'-O)-methylase SpoU